LLSVFRINLFLGVGTFVGGVFLGDVGSAARKLRFDHGRWLPLSGRVFPSVEALPGDQKKIRKRKACDGGAFKMSAHVNAQAGLRLDRLCVCFVTGMDSPLRDKRAEAAS